MIHSHDPLMIQRVYHVCGYLEKDKTKAQVKQLSNQADSSVLSCSGGTNETWPCGDKKEQKLALERRSALAEGHALIMGIFQPRARHIGEDGITPQRVAVTAVRATR